MLLHLPRYADMSIPVGTAELQAVATIVMNTLYPAGIPTTGADVDEDGSEMLTTMPDGAASCRRYTFLRNGGYQAGGDPIYAWFLAPTAAPVGKIVTFYGGHSSADLWDDMETTQPLVVNAALAAGLHVIVCEMPQNGYNPNPSVVRHNDSDNPVANHWLALFNQVVEPNGMRLFMDYPIRALTHAITANPTLSSAGIVSFSGGGFISVLLQIVDARMNPRYTISGYWPEVLGGWVPADGDWEFRYCPILRAAVGGNTDITEAVSAVGGKRVVEIFLDHDAIFPTTGKIGMVDALLSQYITQLCDSPGSVIEHWHDKTATKHEITPWAANAVVADILENL